MTTELVLSLVGLASGVLLFFVGFAFGRAWERYRRNRRVLRQWDAEFDAAEKRIEERIARGARETNGRILGGGP